MVDYIRLIICYFNWDYYKLKLCGFFFLILWKLNYFIIYFEIFNYIYKNIFEVNGFGFKKLINKKIYIYVIDCCFKIWEVWFL